MKSKEYNSVTVNEGLAHFISAKVWNNLGAFRRFGDTIDLEIWGPTNTQDGDENTTGGRLENICGTPYTSAGTNEDQLRFFWDFYRADGNDCTMGEQPSKLDMLKLWKKMREKGGLTTTNFADKLEDAADEIGLPSCLANTTSDDEFNLYQIHNGMEH